MVLNNYELKKHVLSKVKIIDKTAKKYGVQCKYNVIFLKPVFPCTSIFCYAENKEYHFSSFEYAGQSDNLAINIDTKDLTEITYCALWRHVYVLSGMYVNRLFAEIDCYSEMQMRIKNSFFCEMFAALGEEYLGYAIETVKAKNPDYLKKNAMLRIGTLPYILTPRKDKMDSE